MNFHSDEAWGTEVGRVYEGDGRLSYETITSMDEKKISWNCLFKMNFHSDEPWRTAVGRVYEGEGELIYETITSMDEKSHETGCLKWTFNQMSPGGRRLDECTRVKEGILRLCNASPACQPVNLGRPYDKFTLKVSKCEILISWIVMIFLYLEVSIGRGLEGWNKNLKFFTDGLNTGHFVFAALSSIYMYI